MHVSKTFSHLRLRTFLKTQLEYFLQSGRTACNFAPLCIGPSRGLGRCSQIIAADAVVTKANVDSINKWKLRI